MQSLQGSVVCESTQTSSARRRTLTPAATPYFDTVQARKGYYQRLHIVQEYALANLRQVAYRVWDWIERTLRQQQYYHPERPAVLTGVSVAELTKKLNTWAPEARQLSTRTIERALHELQQAHFLAIEHRYRVSPEGIRLQLPSAYRLLCPPALRFLLEREAPAFSDTQDTSGSEGVSRLPDKRRRMPPTRLSDQKKITSTKEKSTSRVSAPPAAVFPVAEDTAKTPSETPEQSRWHALFQHLHHTQGKSLLESLALMCEAEAHWKAGTVALVGGVRICEGAGSC